jgi:hypothetical protein
MLFLPWIFIITVGSTIPLPSLQPIVVLLQLINLPSCLLLKGRQGPALIYQDQDLLCIRSLVTGMPYQNGNIVGSSPFSVVTLRSLFFFGSKFEVQLNVEYLSGIVYMACESKKEKEKEKEKKDFISFLVKSLETWRTVLMMDCMRFSSAVLYPSVYFIKFFSDQKYSFFLFK